MESDYLSASIHAPSTVDSSATKSNVQSESKILWSTMMDETPNDDEPEFVEVRTSPVFQFQTKAVLKTDPITCNTQQDDNIEGSAAIAALGSYLTIQKRRIRCKECDRFSAETEEKMTRHVRRVHRGENPFQCSMCDYSTYNKAVFEEHVRVHQGIKPFKCSHCPYRSASKKNTKKHELIHRPDNPNRCTVCGFIAKHIRSLQRHHKQHATQDLPNQCGYCKMAFENDSTLIHHRLKCSKYLKHQRKIRKINVNIKKNYVFQCGLCEWSGSNVPRILLHLIHHPDQNVDEELVDVEILRSCGIKIGSSQLGCYGAP